MNKLEEARHYDVESVSTRLMEEVTNLRRIDARALARMTKMTARSERLLSRFLPQVEVTISSLEK